MSNNNLKKNKLESKIREYVKEHEGDKNLESKIREYVKEHEGDKNLESQIRKFVKDKEIENLEEETIKIAKEGGLFNGILGCNIS